MPKRSARRKPSKSKSRAPSPYAKRTRQMVKALGAVVVGGGAASAAALKWGGDRWGTVGRPAQYVGEKGSAVRQRVKRWWKGNGAAGKDKNPKLEKEETVVEGEKGKLPFNMSRRRRRRRSRKRSRKCSRGQRKGSRVCKHKPGPKRRRRSRSRRRSLRR